MLLTSRQLTAECGKVVVVAHRQVCQSLRSRPPLLRMDESISSSCVACGSAARRADTRLHACSTAECLRPPNALPIVGREALVFLGIA